MSQVINVTSLLVLCFASIASSLDPAPPSLKYAFGFFRHGVTSPKYKDYLLDIYGVQTVKDLDIQSSGGLGSLSTVGKVQMKDEVGRLLKDRYGAFIGQYREDKLNVTSTRSPITLMSALAAMAGMLPPSPKIFTDLDWQPIPVWYDTSDFDKAYMSLSRNSPEYATSVCPFFGKLFGDGLRQLNSPDQRPETKIMYDILSKHMKRPIKSLQNLADVFDTIYLTERNGIKPPAWATEPQTTLGNQPLYPNLLLSLLNEYFKKRHFVNENKKMLDLYKGPLFNRLVTKFKEVISQPKYPQKMWLHFTDDSTMYVLLKAMNEDFASSAEPGDGVIFELHEVNNQRTIKMFMFEPSGQKKITELKTKKCTAPCTFDTFIGNFKTLTPEEWSKMCNTE